MGVRVVAMVVLTVGVRVGESGRHTGRNLRGDTKCLVQKRSLPDLHNVIVDGTNTRRLCHPFPIIQLSTVRVTAYGKIVSDKIKRRCRAHGLGNPRGNTSGANYTFVSAIVYDEQPCRQVRGISIKLHQRHPPRPTRLRWVSRFIADCQLGNATMLQSNQAANCGTVLLAVDASGL